MIRVTTKSEWIDREVVTFTLWDVAVAFFLGCAVSFAGFAIFSLCQTRGEIPYINSCVKLGDTSIATAGQVSYPPLAGDLFLRQVGREAESVSYADFEWFNSTACSQ